ncbi:MAG: DJ-1/PfpI family protein [Planctomycetota bacterium]
MIDLTGMDVLMVIASGDFRDEEYREPAQALAHVMAGVVVASSSKNDSVGMFGLHVTPDLLLSEVDVSKYAAVVFIGGSGASEYFNDPAAHKIARDAAGQGKLVCAICIAPSTLANAGLLKGKKATCFPAEKDNLVAKGAKFVNKGVVRDGKIITADGPNNAAGFARAICEALAEEQPEEERPDAGAREKWPNERPDGP